MSRFACVVVATSLLAACPGPRAPAPSDEASVRIAIARAEVTRGPAIDELVRRASTGARLERELALRALGRVGSERATPTLVAALHDPDPAIVAAAAGALGVASQLDEPAPSAELTAELVGALARVPDAQRPMVLEAIGRAGDPSAQRAIVPYLANPSPAVVEAAALALARYGRRKLALQADARNALLPLFSGPPAARYAATYALAREHEPPASEAALVAALVARVVDDDPQVRAQAVAAIGKRKLLGATAADGPVRVHVQDALYDRDWRVAVEAVRVLAADDDGRESILSAIWRRVQRVQVDPREAQVVIEGARALLPHEAEGAGLELLRMMSKFVERRAERDIAFAWIDCLVRVELMHTEVAPSYGIGNKRMRIQAYDAVSSFVDACKLPDHLKLPLVVDATAAKVGTPTHRRAAVARLLEHEDPRVRAAGIGALAQLWDDSSEADRRASLTMLIQAIGAPDPIVAGSAVEAAAAFYDKLASADTVTLDAAVTARATHERDAELSAALLDLIGTRTLMAGRDACRAGLAGAPVRAKAARACLVALGESPPPAELAPPQAPPYDVAAVIGTRPVWKLVTTRGPIEIELRPDVAPWAVATIVGLTRKGFYDGLEVHRVVGNFVVQGGDPTMSGWGGPGFALPSEPATLADGAGFVVGGVGIADAGRDSGGSQWFVMHGRAPHLDGRYTWIGAVMAGQAVADALVIGDKVITATVGAAPVSRRHAE
ncbi:MAG TPA: peptidylprolyl isomerase [Kofleriaceae bacterium]|nr:peptidylprolyl isomerase [Kofleriaceae bacterium]